MYRGNKQEKHPKRRKKANRRIGILILSLLLIAAAAIGGTMAYLTAETPQVVNTFTPAEVTTEITEDFDGKVKERIEVKNTGDIAAYIRVKLVTYRVNEAGNPIGGAAEKNQPLFIVCSRGAADRERIVIRYGAARLRIRPCLEDFRPVFLLVDWIALKHGIFLCVHPAGGRRPHIRRLSGQSHCA